MKELVLPVPKMVSATYEVPVSTPMGTAEARQKASTAVETRLAGPLRTLMAEWLAKGVVKVGVQAAGPPPSELLDRELFGTLEQRVFLARARVRPVAEECLPDPEDLGGPPGGVGRVVHPRQVPLMAEATITRVTCRTHQTPAVLTGMPGSRARGARSTNGPCMKARGSPPGRWNLGGREPRQNRPRSARQLPGEAIQAGSAPAPAASTVRSITGTPPRIPGGWGVDRRSRAVGGWLWDGRVT